MLSLRHSRREFLRSAVGLAGLTLPTLLALKSRAALAQSQPKAKSCIILYTWGGIAHQESFDPKPDAPVELRGEFSPIPTATPGIQFCEHIPMLAKHSDKLAVIRSIHHKHGGQQQGMYINLTGHNPPPGVRAKKRNNWPSLSSMIWRLRDPDSHSPGAIRLPYSMYDNGTLMAGEYGGFLGSQYDPILMKTPAGEPFQGKTRLTGREMDLKLSFGRDRLVDRKTLLDSLERDLNRKDGPQTAYERMDHFRQMAADMLLGSPVRDAYDLEKEDPKVREMYGNHICGQSLLLARRLTEAGVPVVQALCSAGDLAGGGGDNWDTHKGHFPKMKDRLLPVFDRSVSALLTDLEQRGRLEDTLVVFLTDFGRTPKINKNGGRDHHPGVYSVALAGGGIRGGQVYGSSDPTGTEPDSDPCTPGDLHATVFQALGIDPRTEIHDQLDRPFPICTGKPLPLV